jgi:hypothetical protein
MRDKGTEIEFAPPLPPQAFTRNFASAFIPLKKYRAMKILPACFAATALFCSCGKKDAESAWGDETPEQHLQHYRESAQFEMLKECTNEVAGISHIITVEINDSASNVAQWTGDTTIDYINHLGGVDRTNLLFNFQPWQDQLICDRDLMREYKREMESISPGSK